MKREFTFAAVLAIMLLAVTAACSQPKKYPAKENAEEVAKTLSRKKKTDINAARIMQMYIDQDYTALAKTAKHLGMECLGKDIKVREDLLITIFARGIDYDAKTDKYKIIRKDGAAIAVCRNTVDGVSWELILADNAEYKEIMKNMESEDEYKLDTDMMDLFKDDPESKIDKIFCKGVCNEELSKREGMRLGTIYDIFFDGERDGYYVVSFLHGNGDTNI
ncbi:hypothetical protein [Prevotella sp. OH937_COT-195]|uniref:hypothetical protein n=1 Tax=Prevotella sp. OH937_COT-195 TaxID=2491051 RepID=UPI000F653407|nr:hypothetical protein [Prevotella sp. OH937_COT-195]RRC98747.1 hypothetical protein EII32_08725 [Prevotella sp. OH937_COT-195]